MFEIGNKVRVIGEETVGVIEGFKKKGRWDYVCVRVGIADIHDYRPTVLRMADDKPLYDHAPKAGDTLAPPPDAHAILSNTGRTPCLSEDLASEMTPDERRAFKQQHEVEDKPARTATVRALKSNDSPEVLFFISLDLDSAYTECARITGISAETLRTKYAKLNPGMQKMNLTNRIRAAYRKDVSK